MFEKLLFWKRKSPPPTTESDSTPGATSDRQTPSAPPWLVMLHSVRGASHASKELPNQDYADYWSDHERSLPLLLAIADGHGSAKSPRSDVGARLAVETAIACARELLGPEQRDLSAIKHAWENELPRELERRWKQAVAEHLATQPLPPPDIAHSEQQQGKAVSRRVDEAPLVAYGATVLLIAIDEAFCACLQLGDGDIVAVDDDGRVAQPMGTDARLLANETTSLCGPQAWQDMRTHFQVITGRPPALLLVATDGYTNAFESAEGFLAVGPDLLDLLADEGEEAVRRALPGWLEEASREGSGDDVTLGIIWRATAVAARRVRSPEGSPTNEASTTLTDVRSSVSADP